MRTRTRTRTGWMHFLPGILNSEWILWMDMYYKTRLLFLRSCKALATWSLCSSSCSDFVKNSPSPSTRGAQLIARQSPLHNTKPLQCKRSCLQTALIDNFIDDPAQFRGGPYEGDDSYALALIYCFKVQLKTRQSNGCCLVMTMKAA